MGETLADQVLLMFSGGRDSTLAALRLSDAGHPLKLVTITAGHLFGLNNVERRLREITPMLPAKTEWLQIVQPPLAGTQHFFHKRTCLPCQSAYVITGTNVARQMGINKIAFGYASYQAGWPEQGLQATVALQNTLAKYGFELTLPAYDIASRASAMDELKARGVSELALEQKCSRQVTNVTLNGLELSQQIEAWTTAIEEELSNCGLLLEVSKRIYLEDLK